MYYYVLHTTYYYALRTTYYYVLRTTYYYALRFTYYHVLLLRRSALDYPVEELRQLQAMPMCCRCNGSGRCRNCSCSKAGKPCVDCLPRRKGRCCNERHTSSQTTTQPSSQTTPQASNIPSVGSACVGSQDTQPPTQPSPDNEMAHETSNLRSMADNSGMSSLTDNNGMIGGGHDFLPE